MAERLRGSDGKFIRKSELLRRWQEDGFEPSHIPSTLLSQVIDTVKSVEGDYGEDHIAALADVHARILQYEHDTRSLSPAEKAELIVLATRDIIGRTNRTDDADQAYRYMRHEILPQVLGAHFFTRSSRELGEALAKSSPVKKSQIFNERSDEFSALTAVSPIVASQVVRRFNELGLTAFAEETDDQEVIFGENKHAEEYLRTGKVEVARMVSRFAKGAERQLNTLNDAYALYDKHDESRRIYEVNIDTKSNRVRVFPINELRLGHQDSKAGLKLVEETVAYINQLPEAEKPHIIVVANLIQGDFAHHQSGKRQALAGGLETDNSQYRLANVVLDLLHETGIPVVLSVGSDDQAMAKDYAKDVVRETRGIARVGGKEQFISYYESNNLIQDPDYQVHVKFYIDHVIPLMYRMGRRLRSAEEVAEATGGELNFSEYMALFDHIINGQELPVELGIDPKIIVRPGEWSDELCVVDDFDLVANTAEGGRRIAYRHSMAFTAETVAQNHMMPTMRLLGSLATNGYTLPDLALTGRGQQAYYLAGALALPGLWDTAQSLNSKQYYATAPGDASRRANFIRGVPGVPTIDMFEMTDDGRMIQSFISKEFMDKADSLPRTAVFELCDTQWGSPSARPDLQIMYLSYMLEVAEEVPIAIQVAGDIIHGHIYPDFPEESQAVGLIKLKSQKLMVLEMLSRVFDTSDPVIKSLVGNIIDVVVQPGNHDKIMRPRFPNNLDDNIDYLYDKFKQIVDVPGETSRVRHDAVFQTREGVPVGTWMARTHLGAYSILTAHYHLERGMKSGASGYPVADAYRRAQGLGAEEKADVLWGAHWHNTQSAMFGKKLSVVGGPMAGQTNFEDFRGMYARPAGTVIYLGGKKPLQLEFVSSKTLHARGVKYGFFTPKNLRENGYEDDPGFDFTKHGPYSMDAQPKSGMQKAILHLSRRASQLADFEGQLDNPNLYDADGQPLYLNDATRRAFELANKR